MTLAVTCPRYPVACKFGTAKNRCLLAKAHASALHTSTLEQQRAFLELKACTPVCLAEIVELKPGYKALVAASDIQAGETVLELLDCNSLSVPVDPTTASDWKRNWLEPFAATHGQLPQALLTFLLDFRLPYISRLATQVLYMKQAAARGGCSSLWGSWFELLPPLTAATHPGAGWSAAEIRDLQFEPTMALMAHNSNVQNQWCSDLVAALTRHNPPLDWLVDHVDDVRWALFIAKTRSVRDFMSSSLYPLHDFLNHDFEGAANCDQRSSRNRYCIIAERDIKTGTELMTSYTPPEGACNTDLLLAWGFTTSTWRREWALPQVFHLLPPVHVDTAAAAAAAATVQYPSEADCADTQNNTPSPATSKKPYAYRLLAAVASLPLASDSCSGPQAVAAANGYQRAAKLLQKYGLSHPIHQQQPDDCYNKKSNRLDRKLTDWRDQCVLSNYDTLLTSAQDRGYLSDDLTYIAELLAVAASETNQPNSCTSAQQEFLVGWARATTLASQQQTESIQLQRLSAAALHCECQLLLLQAGTTIEQDQELLQALQQQQQQGMESADVSLKACTGTGGSSSSSSSVAAFSASAYSASDHSKCQQGLKRFQTQQQQLVRNLIMLQASRLADSGRINLVTSASSSNNSNTGSAHGSSDGSEQAAAEDMRTAALQVLRTLGAGRLQLQQQQQLMADTVILLAQQQVLLQQLQQQQQRTSDSSKLGISNDAHIPQMQTAVTFRLERKKLLVLLSEVTQQAETVLTGLLEG